MNDDYPFFVQAARVAAHFHFASVKAKALLLTAHNARAISARAGHQAVGFKAITDFIDVLASNTMAHANKINRIAVQSSRMAALQSLQDNALACFNLVIEKSVDAPFVSSVLPYRDQVQSHISTNQIAFNRNLLLLNELLEETQKQIMSATIISSTSKIEATLAGDYRQQLESIAVSIEKSAHDINQELSKADRLMKQAQKND